VAGLARPFRLSGTAARIERTAKPGSRVANRTRRAPDFASAHPGYCLLSSIVCVSSISQLPFSGRSAINPPSPLPG
jgi:hypothetical protein